MKIAYTMAPGRGDTDLLLFDLSRRLLEKGIRTTGVVQINAERDDAGPCDMDVKVLPDGPAIRISQSLGREARGCRLDPAALERAVGLVETRLASGSDCLIVNKFGKHEAEGRGFRTAIAEALSADVPVLVGLNPLNAEAFHQFSGGLATELPPNVEDLVHWMFSVTAARSTAA
jgi:nucleoside-triphosphatase THEP1